MKKVLIITGLVIVMMLVYGCKGDPPPPPPEEPIAVVDTTPEPPPPPPPPPQVEEPVVKEADFLTVYFDFDKYNIRGDQKTNLDKNADILRNNSDLIIKLEGHCDERGTVEYNLGLGDKRAVSVKEYLVDLGIDADRVEVISYGKERPADPGQTEAAWAKNRRAEFRIISKK